METVTLLDDDGALGRMLRVAAAAQTVFGGATLVGGLAVVARCQHGRVTRDVDSVIETERPLGLELARIGTQVGPHTTLVDGVTVDLIPVGDVALDDTLRVTVEDVKDRLFIAGHRWAVDTAAPLRVVTTSDPVAMVLQVAAPAALVATKAHALLDRSTKGNPKMGSDLIDLLALCGQHGDEIRTELRHAPPVLTDAVAACLRSVVADEVRLLRVVRAARVLVPGLAPEAVTERILHVLPT